MLVKKLTETGTVVVAKRDKLDGIMREQDFGSSNRAKQGAGVRIPGVDTLLTGDVKVFEPAEHYQFGQTVGIFRKLPKQIFVVAVSYRLGNAR
jgi:curli biogenesis system outer membrane secretion channel CsgG